MLACVFVKMSINVSSDSPSTHTHRQKADNIRRAQILLGECAGHTHTVCLRMNEERRMQMTMGKTRVTSRRDPEGTTDLERFKHW